MLKWDGHTHTSYCPHGTNDRLHHYIEKAIREGFQCYSITEHAPLPSLFEDPVPEKDSAMDWRYLEDYLQECESIKKEYAAHIQIKVGLEVDYLFGWEIETRKLLDQIGDRLDDSILSVHFLPMDEYWVCLDYSPQSFAEDLLTRISSIDHLYHYYYQIVLHAVQSDLGRYKPTRIGHLSLIEKFKKKFPSQDKAIWWNKAMEVLSEIKLRGYQLDVNTAGLQKPLCRDIYPSPAILKEAQRLQIPFIYGSDAHQAKDVGHHYEQFVNLCSG